MPPARSAGEEPLRRVERFRTVFWLLLLGSWVLAVVYMWEAMSTIPSAERLEQTRLVEIPGPRRFFSAATFSLMELTVVLAALWPWRPAYYGTRLAITSLAVLTWFIMTTPMDLSRMDWVHRRWLAWLVLAQVVALVVLLIHRLVRGVRDRRTPPH
jgi:hypothetical protein